MSNQFSDKRRLACSKKSAYENQALLTDKGLLRERGFRLHEKELDRLKFFANDLLSLTPTHPYELREYNTS